VEAFMSAVQDQKRHIMATIAMFYANGQLHLGHMLEAIQADIWVRFQKMRGHEVVYVSGDDAHGTPIMIGAEKQGLTPEELINAVHKDHLRDFASFHIDFSVFHSTHSEENQKLTELLYQGMEQSGAIKSKVIEQAYDTEKNIFLPDRFVKGTCPKCGALDQYGDNCEVCGATYDPTDLIDPKSVLTGTTPVTKESEHIFFELNQFKEKLEAFLKSGVTSDAVVNKLMEWFKDDLRDWDISRDAPYFGFKIPGTEDKYFYVWVDAPVGYLAGLKYLETQGKLDNVERFIEQDSQVEMHHFIGKDITYFHLLFWPAMLISAGWRVPSKVHVHGYLTMNGQKLSKSRGTLILAKDFVDRLNPEYLRYYLAAKLNDQVEDIDINTEDFVLRINSDLVGKIVNIASRSAGFIKKKFDLTLADHLDNPELQQQLTDAASDIADDYENRLYSKAVRKIMALADLVNQYIDQQKPWQLAKEEGQLPKVHAVCTQALNAFKVLMVYLKPILPEMAKAAEAFLNIEPLEWADVEKVLLDTQINVFKPLMQRVDAEVVAELIATSTR
jgi:methionyl-tRNA synthetase